MRAFGRRQERASPDVRTPDVLKEHVKSHPLDVDSDSEVQDLHIEV